MPVLDGIEATRRLAGPGVAQPLAVVVITTFDLDAYLFRAVARGRTNEEIADELHISLGTVKSHVANLMAKLGVRNRVELAVWAYETHRVGR
jgi:DNA-binding NarL/FixJ family response regulator